MSSVASEGLPASIDFASASGRPRPRDRSSQIEQQLFAATTRLLEKTSARDLSVAQIIEEAGVSRGTYYHYFSSKWELINSLVASSIAAIYAPVMQFVEVDENVPRQEALKAALRGGCVAWANNRAVLRAVYEHWREVPELKAMQLALLEPFQRSIVVELERERAAGLAPPGADANQVVAALLWSSLTCLNVAGLEEVPEIPDEAAVAEVLIDIWMRTLYGVSGAD
jgi:AcrR family transcriptional regulator